MVEFYIYEYVRLDYNEPFYIGKGSGERWKSKKNRGKRFLGILKETDVAVNILHENLTEQEAYELECWYIWQYRDVLGYNLANITDGGEGGDTLSNMPKEQLEEYKERMRKIKTGIRFTKEHKKKIGEALKDREFSEETRRKISESKKGTKHTEESKEKISQKVKGERNPMYGKVQKESTRKLIGEKNTKRVLVVDNDGNTAKRFDSSHDLRYSDWRLQFPSPNGINHVGKCLTKGLDFHGYKIIYES
jgi:hypothetical protein